MAKVLTLPARVQLLSADIAKPLPAVQGRADPARAGTTARGYGWQWQQLRLRILQRDAYRCQLCKRAGRLTPARDVDHIVSKAEWLRVNGSLDGVDDPAQLQSLCKPCHDAKSETETAGQFWPRRY